MTIVTLNPETPEDNTPDRVPAIKTLVCQAMGSALLDTLRHPEEGILTVVGDTGVGKTTAIYAFLDGPPLPVEFEWVVCSLSPLTSGPQSGLRELSRVLGSLTNEKGAYLEDEVVRRCQVLRSRTKDRRVLLVVDEAQFATVDLLEELRIVYDRTLISIALVGNVKLRRTVQQLAKMNPQIKKRFGEVLELGLDDADIYMICEPWRLTPAALKRARNFARLGGALGTLSYLLPKAARLRPHDKAPIDVAQIETAAAKMGLMR